MDARKQTRKRLDAAVKSGRGLDSSICLIDGLDFKGSKCPHSFAENEMLYRAYRDSEILRRYI